MSADSKIEIKIFLTFIILYIFFIHWVGWNEESRLALTRAIVEEKRIEIDSFYNTSGDRSYYNSHYYSDKAPGSSFLNVPIYAVWNFIFNKFIHFGEEEPIYIREWGLNVYVLFNPNKKILYAQLLSTIFLSAVPGALIVVLIYKISKYFIKENRIFVTLAFGFGSLIFPYSNVFFGNVLSALFCFFAFYIFVKTEKERSNDKSYFIIGFFSSFAIFIDYTSLFIWASLFFIILISKKNIRNFLIGSFIGIFPLLLYNFSIFGSPFKITLFYFDQNIIACPRLQGIAPCDEVTDLFFSQKINRFMFLFFKLLFFPYRGLFFYSPFLLFSVLGVLFMYKKEKNISIFITLSFLLFVSFNSSLFYWDGGSSFGPRYLLIIIPFLSIPTFFIVDKIKEKKIIFIFFVILVLLSIFHNLLGLSNIWEEALYWSIEDYKNKLYSLTRDPGNPLYEHYLPEFLKYGPRSRILESFLIEGKVDVRDFSLTNEREIYLFSSNYGISMLEISFITILILSVLMLLIWKEEIFRKMSVGLFLLFLIIVFVVSKFDFKDIAFDKNWYPIKGNETIKWMSKNASIYIFSSKEKEVFLNISLITYRTKTLSLFLNDNFINSYITPVKIFENVTLQKGINKLQFYSIDGCEIPIYVENSRDPRCLSFGVKNIEIIEKDKLDFDNNLYYGSNWYPEESTENKTYRHLSQNATVFLPSYQGLVKLNISLSSYKNPKVLNLFLNGKLVNSYFVDSSFKNIITPAVEVDKDINILEFHSQDGCDIPAKIENSTDFRCLSFTIENITVLSLEKLLEENNTVIFGENWYQKEKDGVWSMGNSTIFLLSPRPIEVILNISLLSYNKPRVVNLYVNNNKVDSYLVNKNQEFFLTNLTLLQKGENTIFFETKEKCEIPKEVEGINDTRCLSFKISDINFLFMDELIQENNTIIFGDKWYSKERFKDKSFRWMSNDGRVYLLFDKPTLFRLNLTSWSFNKIRSVKVFLDGIFIDTYTISKGETNLITPIIYADKGIHVLKFHVLDGCEIVGEEDKRCLSIAINGISVVNEDNLILDVNEKYDKNWHGLEKYNNISFRWIPREATYEIVSLKRNRFNLLIDSLWSYNKPRNLEIYVNDNLTGKMHVDSKKEKKIEVYLEVGKNIIRFVSIDGCEKPIEIEKTEDTRCLSVALNRVKLSMI
jgi:hypothetical protein